MKDLVVNVGSLISNVIKASSDCWIKHPQHPDCTQGKGIALSRLNEVAIENELETRGEWILQDPLEILLQKLPSKRRYKTVRALNDVINKFFTIFNDTHYLNTMERVILDTLCLLDDDRKFLVYTVLHEIVDKILD